MESLPWVHTLLKPIEAIYKEDPTPEIKIQKPTPSDYEYIKESYRSMAFDKTKCASHLHDKLFHKQAKFEKILLNRQDIVYYIHESTDTTPPDWKLWAYACSLLSPHKSVRVVYYACPRNRFFPPHYQPIGPEHINGGETLPCDPTTIKIFRKEEAYRVFLHELLHASCSDLDLTYNNAMIPYNEANTEAWAEIILCGILAQGNVSKWKALFEKQMRYALQQQKYTAKYYHVRSPKDYAWRYIAGRIDTWSSLGIPLPEVSFPAKLPGATFTIFP
jgi:hypothetical protein